MNILEKIEYISAKECEGLSRLPYNLLIGFCGVVFNKAGVPRVNPIPEEYFDAVINGIIDEIYDGCEPEFETEEEYEKYEDAISKLKKCTFDVEQYSENKDYFGNSHIKGPKSPYKDKTIPFLAYRENA